VALPEALPETVPEAVPDEPLLEPLAGAGVGAVELLLEVPLFVALELLLDAPELLAGALPVTAVGLLVVDPEVAGATAVRGVSRYHASATMMSRAMIMPTMTPAP
jgi:hypothetical protein